MFRTELSFENKRGNITQVSVDWHKAFFPEINEKVRRRMYKMAVDIEKDAKLRAPVLSGALVNSIRTEWSEEDEFAVYVRAGGVISTGIDPRNGMPKTAFVNYAVKREKGPNRSHDTEHYMENAMRTICSGDYISTYFGDVTQ